MKIKDTCITCLVNQAIKTANLVGIENKESFLKNVFSYLSTIDFKTMTSPEIFGEFFNFIKKECGNDDPYKDIRREYNEKYRALIPAFYEDIKKSTNSFEIAVKYSIIGNIIDFGPNHELTEEIVSNEIGRLKNEEFGINHIESLRYDIERSNTLLYIGDNCGEICFDKLLLMEIKQLNPDINIYFATRGEPVINDSIEEDAYFVGIDEFATIISNGDSSCGTVLSKTSYVFNKIYEKADVIISKGQANFECLSGENKNIYFLLVAKCDLIAEEIGTLPMKMIVKASKNEDF